MPMFCVYDLGEGPSVTQAYVVYNKLHPGTPPAASFVDFTCIQLDEGQESRNGLPFSPPGDLPDPGIEPESPVFPALVG